MIHPTYPKRAIRSLVPNLPLAGVVKRFWKGKEDPRPVYEKGSRTYFY
jgi:hypothetical protein